MTRARVTRYIAFSAITALVLSFSFNSSLAKPAAAAATGCEASILRMGDSGSCVAEAQRLLAEQGAFTGDYTAYFGTKTRAAVLLVQRQNGISQTGNIGPLTWGVLTGGGNTANTTEAEDNARPSNAADTGGSLPSACNSTATKSICIVKASGSQATLYAIENGNIIQTMAARTGDARGPSYVTPAGHYSIGRKYVHYYSKEFDGAPMPYSMFFVGGDAIHYSSDFARCNYSRSCGAGGASHGCVNIKDWDGIVRLFDWAPVGTPVTVTR